MIMKPVDIFIIVLLVVTIAAINLETLSTIENKILESQNKVCFEENCFNVELAITPSEKSLGLMHRESMNEDAGMLFIYKSEGRFSFWMMNTYIPLDMIWIDKDHVVVDITKEAQPCGVSCPGYSPSEPAMYVLEINGGISDKIGLDVGDKLDFYIVSNSG